MPLLVVVIVDDVVAFKFVALIVVEEHRGYEHSGGSMPVVVVGACEHGGYFYRGLFL